VLDLVINFGIGSEGGCLRGHGLANLIERDETVVDEVSHCTNRIALDDVKGQATVGQHGGENRGRKLG
jgi:hypothetical protein